MENKYVLELEIKSDNVRFLHSLHDALKPDTQNTPPNCRVDVCVDGKVFYLRIECLKLNDLRALFNSYYNILSSIMHLGEEIV